MRTHVHEELNDHLAARPTDLHELGDIHHGIDHSAEQLTAVMKTVGDGGPNHGMSYLTDLPFRYDATIHINTQALSRGSDFYDRQRERRPDFGTACSQRDVERAADLARAHEGTALQQNSHAWFYVRKFNEIMKQSGTAQQLEPLVGYLGLDATTVNITVYDLIVEADSLAKRESDRADSRGTNNFQPGCNCDSFNRSPRGNT